MEGIVQALVNFFSETIPAELTVFLLSLMPIIELRGGILAAKLLSVELWPAFFICLVGTLLPTPFILLFITAIFNWLKKTKLFRPMVEKLESRAMNKKDQIEKYEFWGLLLFVGIPLPGTGAWTGSLIAALLGIRFKKAFPAVILGVLLAAFIMTILSYTILGSIFA